MVGGPGEVDKADSIMSVTRRRIHNAVIVGQEDIIGPSLNQVACIDSKGFGLWGAIYPGAIRHPDLKSTGRCSQAAAGSLRPGHVVVLPQEGEACVVGMLTVPHLPRQWLLPFNVGRVVCQAHGVRGLVGFQLSREERLEVPQWQVEGGGSERHGAQKKSEHFLPIALHDVDILRNGLGNDVVAMAEVHHGLDSVKRPSLLHASNLAARVVSLCFADALRPLGLEAAAGASVWAARVRELLLLHGQVEKFSGAGIGILDNFVRYAVANGVAEAKLAKCLTPGADDGPGLLRQLIHFRRCTPVCRH
mmetsp:Transcript_101058/g.240823  ORF Transcript_101058/g.240823 Transcript_101058/m.240823 type:complete len:305 (-) Transcript_101058:123-1037(-)